MAAASDLRRGFEFGPFEIIPERGIVRKDGEDVRLEPKQMDALVTLARHHPGVVSKDMLVEEVWDGRPVMDESIVQCIKGIRQALDKDDPRNPKYVETIHGRGYRMMVPIKLPEAETPEVAPMRIPRSWIIGTAAAILVLVGVLVLKPDFEPVDSVVVMQFENLSRAENRADNQWIVDGFSRQLISTLYAVPDLRVLNGNLPEADESPTDMAERYGVNAVVSGSVQELNGEVLARVTIYADDPSKQWGDNFEGTLGSMFDMHEEVAEQVRSVIVRDGGTTTVATPNDSDAYLDFLEAESYLAKRDVDSLKKAVEIFTKSTKSDPNYSPAYLALANTYLLLADYPSDKDMFELALDTIDAGIDVDPSISEHAETYRGYVHTKNGEWEEATAAFDIAINSSVEYPPAQHYYSRLTSATGRIDDSLAAAQAAWEMDQDEQVLNSRLAIAHLWKNDLDEARKYYEIANAKDEGAPIHLLSYTLFLIREGDFDNASRWAERGLEKLTGVRPEWVAPVFEAMKHLPESEPMVAALLEYSEQGAIGPTALVTLWAIAGEADRAMQIAWKMVEENDPSLFELELIYLDEFSGMRQHEDFPRFLDEIGLTEYWPSVGCRWDEEADAVVCDSPQ